MTTHEDEITKNRRAFQIERRRTERVLAVLISLLAIGVGVGIGYLIGLAGAWIA